MNRHFDDHDFSPTGSPAVGVWSRPVQDQPISDLLVSILNRWIGLLIWSCACLALAFLYLFVAQPEYTSTTSIILNGRRPTMPVSSLSEYSTLLDLDAAQADSQIQVLKSERLLRLVFETVTKTVDGQQPTWGAKFLPAKKAGRDQADADEAAFLSFMNKVSARRVGSSYVIETSFSAADPNTAARGANAVTAAFIWDQIAAKAASAQSGSELQSRVADLIAERDYAYAAVREGATLDRRLPDADARVISAAMTPTRKSAPQTIIILVSAITFALASGIIVSATIEGLDNRVRTRRRLMKFFRADCLAEIPKTANLSPGSLLKRQGKSTSPALDAAFENLATALMANFSGQQRTVGIVAWAEKQGASTVAAGLSAALAKLGESVTLIDAAVHTSALTEAVRSRPSNQATPADGDWSLSVGDHATLNFVPLFPGLSSRTGHAVQLARLKGSLSNTQSRWSIVDLPPLGKFNAARAFSAALDDIVVVVDSSRTTFESLAECVAILALHSKVVGVVLNSPHSKRNRISRLVG